MYRHRYIGGKHTDVNNLRKGFPKDQYKLVEEAIDELIRDGLLIVKPTHYGRHVSINQKMLSEVRKIIEEELNKDFS